MSQRLTNDEVRPLPVVGYRIDGQPIYTIAGGSVDAGTETDNANKPADDAGAAGNSDGATDAGGSPDGGDKSSPDLDKALERMRAADRAKSAAEQALADANAKLREFEDKDKSDLEKAQRDADEARAAVETLTNQLKSERISNAFLTNNTYQWHNPERALSLIDLSEVTISDDGKVTGLDKAIKALAESDPYLLKPAGDTSGDKLPPSGSNTGGGGKPSGAKADRDKLLDKYPALRK